jgi:hypothetical protein
METLAISAARASRWAAMLVCSLGLATPCAAVPLADDANGPPAPGVSVAVAADAAIPASEPYVPIDPLMATGSDTSLPSAPLLPDAFPLPVRGVVRGERARDHADDDPPPGGALLRTDSLPGMLDSLLDQGILVPEAEKTYRALPGMLGTPPVLAAGSVAQSPARGESADFSGHEMGFNVMRWTSAALAVLAVVGTVTVLVMPGLRRRVFFPDIPQMPPSPA